jgi:hypothetical protein
VDHRLLPIVPGLAHHKSSTGDYIKSIVEWFGALLSSTMSASRTLSFDASEVMNAIEDDLPDNPSDPSSWRPAQLRGLLNGFVQGSKGVLDTKYKTAKIAKELFETHPELRDILVTAWNKKEYGRVLNLSTSRLRHLLGAKLII